MKKQRRKTGDIVIEILKEEKTDSIGYETFGMLDEVFHRAKKEGILRDPKESSQRKPHPLNRHQSVLNALDRDNRFKKWYIPLDTYVGVRQTRMFTLKEAQYE